MARIRTVKPSLFRHEDLFEAEKESGLPLRLAFIGLFTCCDREGRFPWRPRTLKLDVMPHDDIDMGAVMEALWCRNLIQKYEVGGELYGCIPTWNKHQTINQREAASTIPAPDGERVHVHARAEIVAHVPRGTNVPKPLADTIFARDDHKCLRCNATTDLTIDHIFPRSIGGTHAPSNLRSLCRKCNSARPVAGQALIEDLAKDGFTLSDMQRICAHVHAPDTHVGNMEGKGREEEGKGIAALRTAAVAAENSLPSRVEISEAAGEPLAGEPPSWWPKRDRYGRVVGEIDKALVNKVGAIVIKGKPWSVLSELRRVYKGDERAVMEMLLLAEQAVNARDYCMGVVKKMDGGFPQFPSHEKYPESEYRDR